MRGSLLLVGIITATLVINPLCHHASGQSSNLMRTDLVGPSPTVANLSKYGDIPVTYYTGLPNVSVPIFNVSGSELSVPVSLSYNFSGLQPYQKPGWVGLGWSLQAGGVVTRTINDKIDDHYPNPYNPTFLSQGSFTQQYMMQSVELGTNDNEPDVYNFSFGNYSGKFIKYNGQYHLMPSQKIKIQGGSGGFTFITEDGTQYIFTDREQTYPRGTPGGYSLHEHTSSWYLTKIRNATRTDSIMFTYANEGRMLQYGARSQTYDKWENIEVLGQLLHYGIAPPNNAAPLNPVSELFPTKIAPLRLYEIRTAKYTVYFAPQTTNRQDIMLDPMDGTAQSRELKSITVNSHDGVVVKHFDFEYSYTPNTNKILLLNAIIDRGTQTGSAVYQKHTFEYETPLTGGSGGTFPYCQIDQFSYNTSMTGPPDLYSSSNMISAKIYPYTGGVNREPNLPGIMYGALKKINYPTGGSTSFSYEHTRYYTDNSFIINRLEAANQATRGDSLSVNQIIQTDTFKINVSDTVFVRLIRVPKQQPPPEQQDVPHDNVEEIQIYKIFPMYDDEPVPNIIGWFQGALQHTGKIMRNEFNATYDYKIINFPVGNYVLKVICDEDEYDVFAQIIYDDHTDKPNLGKVGPGMRLNQLEHNNGFGKTITKRFLYLDANGFQSGQLLQDALFEARPLRKAYHQGTFMYEVASATFTQYTSSVGERAGIGLPFYHQRVVEESIAGEDTLRSVYNFQNYPDFQGVELWRKEDYLWKNSAYELQATAETTFGGGALDFSLPVLKIYPDVLHIPELPTDYITELHPTYYKGKWQHPEISRQTQYESGQALVTETKSYYNAVTRNLTATKQTLSDGTSFYTRYKYPQDYNGATADLIAANMLAVPIEEQVWRKDPTVVPPDSTMISGKINQYTGIRLTSIYVLETNTGIRPLDAENTVAGKYVNIISDSRYKKKIEFKYNNYGKIVQQQLTDHPPVSYLWGYPSLIGSGAAAQGVYPIAQIQNAKADSVFYTSFESGTETSMPSVTGTKAHSGSFQIQATYNGKYMLTYWKKTGSAPWQLIQQQLNSPSWYQISASGSFLDEVRLYPVSAQMTTYAYSGGLGIQSVNDANNKVTSYIYDPSGKLKHVKDSKGNITNAYEYHVKDQVNAVE